MKKYQTTLTDNSLFEILVNLPVAPNLHKNLLSIHNIALTKGATFPKPALQYVTLWMYGFLV